jgi:hypothetical protein
MLECLLVTVCRLSTSPLPKRKHIHPPEETDKPVVSPCFLFGFVLRRCAYSRLSLDTQRIRSHTTVLHTSGLCCIPLTYARQDFLPITCVYPGPFGSECCRASKCLLSVSAISFNLLSLLFNDIASPPLPPQETGPKIHKKKKKKKKYEKEKKEQNRDGDLSI